MKKGSKENITKSIQHIQDLNILNKNDIDQIIKKIIKKRITWS